MQGAALSCWMMIRGYFLIPMLISSWLSLLETCHLTVYSVLLSQHPIFSGRHLKIDDRNRGNRSRYATFDPGELWIYLPTPKKGLTGWSFHLQVSSFCRPHNLCITHVHTYTHAFYSLVRVIVRCICCLSLIRSLVWLIGSFFNLLSIFFGGKGSQFVLYCSEGVGCP